MLLTFSGPQPSLTPFLLGVGRVQRVGDAGWELAVALDEHLVRRWTENAEGIQQPGSCLIVGNRGSYSQQKERMDRTETPCTTSNNELLRGGFLRRSL